MRRKLRSGVGTPLSYKQRIKRLEQGIAELHALEARANGLLQERGKHQRNRASDLESADALWAGERFEFPLFRSAARFRLR